MRPPRFEFLEQKKLIGQSTRMSFAHNTTSDLWRSFMPRRKEIYNVVGRELYSIEIYPDGFFNSFSPNVHFVKWAAIEVRDFDAIPHGMETLIIPPGLYAIFLHKGPASDGPKTYEYIFRQWLPGSGYHLDNRPHFAVMGERYRKDDPSSEEDIWIPVIGK